MSTTDLTFICHKCGRALGPVITWIDGLAFHSWCIASMQALPDFDAPVELTDSAELARLRAENEELRKRLHDACVAFDPDDIEGALEEGGESVELCRAGAAALLQNEELR